MKRMLIFAALSATSTGAMAQAAALQVRNFNQNCGIYVVMDAAAPTEGNSYCQIKSCQFYLAPSTTTGYAYTSLTAFASGPGFCYENTTIPATTLATLTDWNWTDVEFQWDCTSYPGGSGCGNSGAAMSENGTSYPLPFTCHNTLSSWGPSCGGGTCTWTSSLSGAAMANVQVDFH